MKKQNLTRRSALTRLLAAAPAIAMAAASTKTQAAPNGTRPTVLSQIAVTSLTPNTMRVSGRLATIDGVGVAGMQIDVYSVGIAYLTRWSTMYTDIKGNFSAVVAKPMVGSRIQIEIASNGAYNRPLPTFNRP